MGSEKGHNVKCFVRKGESYYCFLTITILLCWSFWAGFHWQIISKAIANHRNAVKRGITFSLKVSDLGVFSCSRSVVRVNFLAWGFLTYLAERGCAALMGPFLQEILKHGSHFLPKKSLNMGQLFWMSTKCCNFGFFFAMRKPRKSQNVWKICPKWPYFSRKILKNGYPLKKAKITLTDGYGFLSLRGTSLSNSNLSTPPPPRAFWKVRCWCFG